MRRLQTAEVFAIVRPNLLSAPEHETLSNDGRPLAISAVGGYILSGLGKGKLMPKMDAHCPSVGHEPLVWFNLTPSLRLIDEIIVICPGWF